MALGERAVEGVDDLQRLMVSELIGTSVTATVVRRGELVETELVPAELSL